MIKNAMNEMKQLNAKRKIVDVILQVLYIVDVILQYHDV